MTRQPLEKRVDSDVIVDTSVWVEYFRGKNQKIILCVEELIERRLLRILPIILAELLRGCLNQKEINFIRSTIEEIPSINFGDDFWSDIGLFCFKLARRGCVCSLIDGFIAKATIISRNYLFTLDQDFLRISKLTSLRLFTI